MMLQCYLFIDFVSFCIFLLSYCSIQSTSHFSVFFKLFININIRMLPLYQESKIHYNSKRELIFKFVLIVSFMVKGIAADNKNSFASITENVSSTTETVSPWKNISTTTTITSSKKANNKSTTRYIPGAHSTMEDNSTMIVIIPVAVIFFLLGISIILYCFFCESSNNTDVVDEEKSRRGKSSKAKRVKVLSTKTKKSPSFSVSSKKSPVPSIKSNKEVVTTVPDKALKSKVAEGGGGGVAAVPGSQIQLGSILLSSPYATQNVGAGAVVKSQSGVKSTVAGKSWTNAASKSKLDGKRKMSSIEKNLLKAKNALKSTTSNVKSYRSAGFYIPGSSFQSTR